MCGSIPVAESRSRHGHPDSRERCRERNANRSAHGSRDSGRPDVGQHAGHPAPHVSSSTPSRRARGGHGAVSRRTTTCDGCRRRSPRPSRRCGWRAPTSAVVHSRLDVETHTPAINADESTLGTLPGIRIRAIAAAPSSATSQAPWLTLSEDPDSPFSPGQLRPEQYVRWFAYPSDLGGTSVEMASSGSRDSCRHVSRMLADQDRRWRDVGRRSLVLPWRRLCPGCLR